MKNIEAGHNKVSFINLMIEIVAWFLIAGTVIGGLVWYILYAKEFSGIANMSGMLAGYFFLYLFASAIVSFFIVVIKNIAQIKIDFYDDVKYVRDSISQMVTVMKNGLAIETRMPKKPKGSNELFIKTSDGSDICLSAIGDKYYLWNVSCSAYLVGVHVEGEAQQTTFSRDVNNAMCFPTRVSALEYSSKNRLDAVKDFLIISNNVKAVS